MITAHRIHIRLFAIAAAVSLQAPEYLLAQSLLENGRVFYTSRKYDEAERSLKSVQRTSSDYAAARYYLGRIAYDKKEYDDASEYFENAAKADPTVGDYFGWLGDSYSAIGSEANVFRQMSVGPKALRAWEKATKLDSKNIKARVSLTEFYRMAPGFMGGGIDKSDAMAKEAFALLEEAIRTTPDNHLYLYWYGKSSALTGLSLDRGEMCMEKYVRIIPREGEPSVAGAYMRLGQIKEKKGNKAEAKKSFEAALKLDTKLKQAREGLERTSR